MDQPNVERTTFVGTVRGFRSSPAQPALTTAVGAGSVRQRIAWLVLLAAMAAYASLMLINISMIVELSISERSWTVLALTCVLTVLTGWSGYRALSGHRGDHGAAHRDHVEPPEALEVAALCQQVRSMVAAAGPDAADSSQFAVNPQVQAALRRVGAKDRTSRRGEVEIPLSELDLRGYLLDDLDFTGADLRGSNLSDCSLADTQLDGANLRDARLDGVIGPRASFRRAVLDRTSMVAACLPVTDFAGAILLDVDLRRANLAEAAFDRATVGHCVLTNADLKGTTLRALAAREPKSYSAKR